MNKFEALNLMEKKKYEYWNVEDSIEIQYRKAKKEVDKLKGLKSKASKLKNEIIELKREYEK